MVPHADTLSICICQSLVSIVDNIFFAVRVIKVWNSLPDEVVATDRLSMFICRLKHTNLSQFILGKV